MRRSLAFLVPFSLLLVLLSPIILSTQTISPTRPVHTYSIVARDAKTGELGVAVQSHWFSVGPIVPWAEAGVGAIATQSLVDISYGPLGLELMRGGKSADETLRALLEADSRPDIRQVAMIDTQGGVAAHTGENCIDAAGHLVGNAFSVQANLMLSERVWPAMSEAYEKARGDLADRLLAALEAAEREGGDIRGRQSAAILIVSGEKKAAPWQGIIMNLRVEDHPHPLEELRRLVTLHRAYAHMNAGDLAIEENDPERALEEYSAAQRLAPENIEMKFWHAVSLVNMGRAAESIPIFRAVFQADKNWSTLLPRLPKSGLFPHDPNLLRKVLSVAPKH